MAINSNSYYPNRQTATTNIAASSPNPNSNSKTNDTNANHPGARAASPHSQPPSRPTSRAGLRSITNTAITTSPPQQRKQTKSAFKPKPRTSTYFDSGADAAADADQENLHNPYYHAHQQQARRHRHQQQQHSDYYSGIDDGSSDDEDGDFPYMSEDDYDDDDEYGLGGHGGAAIMASQDDDDAGAGAGGKALSGDEGGSNAGHGEKHAKGMNGKGRTRHPAASAGTVYSDAPAFPVSSLGVGVGHPSSTPQLPAASSVNVNGQPAKEVRARRRSSGKTMPGRSQMSMFVGGDEDDVLPSVTGFAVASNKRNAEFHEVFPNIPEGDYLIEGGFGF